MGLQGKIHRLNALRRRHGLAAVVRTVAARARPHRRRLYLWELTHDAVRAVALPPEQTFRFASSDELDGLARDARWDIAACDLERARGGDRCLLHAVQGERVGYTWVAVAPAVDLAFGVWWPLPPDVAYAYKTFTAPDHRGRGFQPLRSAAVLKQIHREGRVRMLCYTDAVNFSSQRGLVKVGYRRVGQVTVTRRRGRVEAAIEVRSDLWHIADV